MYKLFNIILDDLGLDLVMFYNIPLQNLGVSNLNCAFVPARKPGKLPGEAHRVSYQLEYGTADLEMHKNSITPEAKVVIVDDLLATGGSATAAKILVQEQDAEVHSFAFIVELDALGGRKELDAPVTSVLRY